MPRGWERQSAAACDGSRVRRVWFFWGPAEDSIGESGVLSTCVLCIRPQELSYYYEHRAEIDAEIAAQNVEHERFRGGDRARPLPEGRPQSGVEALPCRVASAQPGIGSAA